METVRILEKPAELSWDYDAEADVLYVSAGKPRPAQGVDIGEGVVLRYDPARREMVGLTVIGLRTRLLKGLSQTADADAVVVRDQPPVARDKPRPKRGK